MVRRDISISTAINQAISACRMSEKMVVHTTRSSDHERGPVSGQNDFFYLQILHSCSAACCGVQLSIQSIVNYDKGIYTKNMEWYTVIK